MWILNQSKEAIFNIDNAMSVEYYCSASHGLKKHAVACCADNDTLNSCIVIGIYSSKERCLEVIQDIVKKIHLKNPTYEIPEK